MQRDRVRRRDDAHETQRVADGLHDLSIELPSWAFGNSGTRFKVFAQQGVPRDPYEKIADAAQVHAFTGARAERRPAHPVGPRRRLRRPGQARRRPRRAHRHDQLQRLPGRRLHARLGHQPRPAHPPQGHRPPARVRRHHGRRPAPATSSCGSPTAPTTPARTTSSPARTGWPRRWPRSTTGSATTSGSCSSTSCSSRPSTRWTCPTGARPTPTASRSARRRRSSSTPATTRRARTSSSSSPCCCGPGKLGGFDFNSRFYADDDLMVGAADPFQLFRIMWEVRRGGGLDPATGVAFMLDQCHNIEPKIAAQIRSVMNVQEATAKALLVDADALAGGPGGRRRARRQRRVHGRLRHRRAPAARRRSGPTWASTPTRSPPTTARATTRGSARSGPTARRRAGERDGEREAGKSTSGPANACREGRRDAIR